MCYLKTFKLRNLLTLKTKPSTNSKLKRKEGSETQYLSKKFKKNGDPLGQSDGLHFPKPNSELLNSNAKSSPGRGSSCLTMMKNFRT